MSWESVEPVSGMIFSFSAVAIFLILPLSDSINPAFGSPRTVRMMASIIAAIKLYLIASCKSSPLSCHAKYHGYTLSVTSATANATPNGLGNATGNTTAKLSEHVIFSTLDLMGSCDVIVLVLSVQILMSNVMSPETTNAIKEPYLRATIHSVSEEGEDAGQGNLCAKLAGKD